MIGLIGKKVGMTQVFDADGKQVAVTVIELGPCHITDLKTPEKHGYTAVQLGFDEKRPKVFNKPQQGQFKKASTPCLKFIREIRTEGAEGLKVGAQLRVDNFEAGDFVDIEGVSIGKGFQGVVKRYNFKGGSASHGNRTGRKPGSTGMSAYPSRTIKGTKLPGQMGNKKISVQNISVVKVDLENDLLAVKGAIPGHEGGYVVVRSALKRGAAAKKWKVPADEQEAPSEQESKDSPAAAEQAEQAPQEKTPQEEKSPQESKPEAEKKSADPKDEKKS